MGIPGPAVYTDVTLENATDETLTLCDLRNWHGTANLPHVIPAKWHQNFQHDADPDTGCSKGAVAYALRSGIKWVVFWSNMNDEMNKVYMDLVAVDEVIDWESYGTLLDNSTSNPVPVNKFEYTPLLTASLIPPR